jgi:guanylate kinase
LNSGDLSSSDVAPSARRGLMMVLSSPSGAGKTTLSRMLLEQDAELSLSVSMTTRPPRPGEVDGRDYWFADRARFEALRDAGEFLEWAQVFSNFYGTPRAPVADMLALGRDVLFDIDWQGARQLREQAPQDVVSVFILPPSRAEQEARLRRRATDSDEVIRRRLEGAAAEIRQWANYEYVIVNEDLDVSFGALRAILAAERLKRTRQTGLEALVRLLLGEG